MEQAESAGATSAVQVLKRLGGAAQEALDKKVGALLTEPFFCFTSGVYFLLSRDRHEACWVHSFLDYFYTMFPDTPRLPQRYNHALTMAWDNDCFRVLKPDFRFFSVVGR